ncbi:MAG: hypothetical protein HYW25_04000, partial [Candidatus Aenigmarchaeota archaeon]|nr:hypothetical protein [Candidatus Aenigmarchaeota archaeon]
SSYYSGMSQSWGGVYIRGFVSPPAYTYSQPAGALGYIRASGISYTRPVYTVQPGFRFYGTFPATRLPSAPASAYPLGAFWIRV